MWFWSALQALKFLVSKTGQEGRQHVVLLSKASLEGRQHVVLVSKAGLEIARMWSGQQDRP